MAETEQMPAGGLPPVVIAKSRSFMLVALALSSLGLVTIGVLLAEAPIGDIVRFRIGIVAAIVLILALLVVVVALPLAIRAALSKEPGLILDETGIRGYGFGHFPWEIIEWVGIDETLPSSPIAIRLRPGEIDKMSRMTQMIADKDRIPLGAAMLKIDKAALDEMMRKYFEAYGSTKAS